MSDVDKLASELLSLGLLGRNRAPSYARAGMREHVMGQEGQFAGWILPGKGFMLPHLDLKRLGITRPLPYVYEWTPFARLRDRLLRTGRDLLASEVGAITTYDGIISARAGGKARDIVVSRASITMASGFWSDTFVATGGSGPGVFLATTAPTDAALTRATAGAWNTGIPDPGGSDKAYLLTLGLSASSAHNFSCLIDRHTQSGSYRLNPTSAETVGSPTNVVRQYGSALGEGNEIVATVTTIRGTPAAGTLTISYSDQAGGASTSPSVAMTTNADPVNRCLGHGYGQSSPFIQLAAGDYGVRNVSASQRAATSDASGAFAMSVVKPLVWMPMLATANIWVERDLPSDMSGLVELANASQVTGCLGLLIYAGAASQGTLTAFLRTAQG